MPCAAASCSAVTGGREKAEPIQSRFALSWSDRRAGPMQTPRRFLDFVVDGEALYGRFKHDYISCLGWFKH
jgi:hypothetical protein